jgi:hypothetical protein
MNESDLTRKERGILKRLRDNWAHGRMETFAGADARIIATLIDRGYVDRSTLKRRNGPGDKGGSNESNQNER